MESGGENSAYDSVCAQRLPELCPHARREDDADRHVVSLRRVERRVQLVEKLGERPTHASAGGGLGVGPKARSEAEWRVLQRAHVPGDHVQ